MNEDPLEASRALRSELQAQINNLGARVRTESTACLVALARQVRQSEIAAVRHLCDFCSAALLARAPVTATASLDDLRLPAPGQIRDLCDDVALEARDVTARREEADAAFSELAWYDGEALQAILKQETVALEEVSRCCTRDAELCAKGLRTVVSDICDVLLVALGEAAAAPTPAEAERVGVRAFNELARAAARWLEWSGQVGQDAAVCPVDVPSELVTEAARDPALAAALGRLRICMRLRRQHVRVLAVEQRVRAAVDATDALSRLSQAIIL